jgi:DNA transposition AAA+ family ATPase
MRENVVISTYNTRDANKMVAELCSRPKTDTPGLAVFFGRPGLGKTTFVEHFPATNPSGIFIRMKEAETPKGFMKRLYAVCRFKESKVLDYNVTGTTEEIYAKIEEIFRRHPEYILLIDEADRAFKGKKSTILEMIRDLADCTMAQFILIGMEQLKTKIEKYSAHYFDRCYYFFEFTAKTGIRATETIINETMRRSNGTLRKAMKIINEIEEGVNEARKQSSAGN